MRKFLFQSFLFFFSFAYSQALTYRKIDDKDFFILQEKAKSFVNSNVDSTFYYVERIEKSSNAIHRAAGLATKSYAFAKQNDFVNAEKNYNEAIILITKSPKGLLKSQTESYIYNIAGLVNWMSGKLPKALDNFFISKKIAISINDVIQINKINQNIANIKRDIGNFKEAIVSYNECNRVIDERKDSFSKADYFQNKANINFNLGVCYEGYFSKNRSSKKLLDSAYYFYSKSLLYSEDNVVITLNVLKNLGNIQFFRHNYVEAEKRYLTAASLAKQNSKIKEYYGCMYNLGLVTFERKEYPASLVYFNKVDSIFNASNFDKINYGKSEYVDSNYRLAKIFEFQKDYNKAIYYSKLYLKNYEDEAKDESNNLLDTNFKLSHQDLKNEMLVMQEKYSNSVLLKNIFFLSLIFLTLLFAFLYIRKARAKREVERKMESILKEFNTPKEEKIVSVHSSELTIVETSSKDKVDFPLLNSEVEYEILSKLKELEDKKIFLKSEYTQQYVAKKIKTNATYLSYVVNKHYNKSFSAYYNELRINFVINEIINNSKFREYTTQAIAESVGFKNADSFTLSFKKKTGLTPFQFINEIKKKGM